MHSRVCACWAGYTLGFAPLSSFQNTFNFVPYSVINFSSRSCVLVLCMFV